MKKLPIPLPRFVVGFIALVMLWGAFLVPSALAYDDIASQLTFNQTNTPFASSGSQPWFGQELGSGLSGVLEKITLWTIVTATSGHHKYEVNLYECSSNTYQTCISAAYWIYDTNGQLVGTAYENEYLLESTYSLNPTKYYLIAVTPKSGESYIDNYVSFEGTTNANDYPNGACSGIPATMGNNCGSVADIKFLLEGQQTNGGHSFAYNLKPQTASTTASTTINFTFNYNAYAFDDIVEYRIKIRDAATPAPSTQVITVKGPATSGLAQSISKNINLTSGHLYYWWVDLCDDTSTAASCYTSEGGQQSFSVVTPFYLSSAWSPIAATSTSGSPWLGISSSTVQNVPEVQCGIKDILSGDCFTSVLSYLFIPSPVVLSQFSNLSSQLSTKIPFSYVYEIENAFNNITLNATSSMPLIVIPLSTVASSTVTGIIPDLELSTSTISTYLSDDNRGILKDLITAGIWLSVGLLFFREAQRIFK